LVRSKRIDRPTGVGVRPSFRSRALALYRSSWRSEAAVRNVMLKEIETDGPFFTQ